MPAKHQSAKHRFTATRSLHFSEDGLHAWAHFTRDRALDSHDGAPGYSFETDDAEVAGRLRGVEGVTEVEAKPTEAK